MEAMVRADDGTVYGYYHNEPHISDCPGKTAPRIGAARSEDNGLHWTDLGIILEAPSRQVYCDSENHYFIGGHGDFSALLDAQQKFLYFFFSNYSGLAPDSVSQRPGPVDQGVSVARMGWADRDHPAGRVTKHYYGTWDREPGLGGLAEPIFPTRVTWHVMQADSFWGPSIHWNQYLNLYVILLNRAIDSGPSWKQEGIYISFAAALDQPKRWTEPYKIMNGGLWYPQIVGEKSVQGTDKIAAQNAVLYQGGRPVGNLTFFRPGATEFCPPDDSPIRCR